LLDHFGMNIRSLFVCSALLLFANVAFGAYQRTKDGKTLVWVDSPKRGEEATWSGRRDKKGFAVGSGTLTWYKAVPTFETGSLIPDTRHAVAVTRYSGKMVHGKFKGTVTYVDANGRKRSVNVAAHNRQSPRKKATSAPTPAVTVAPTAEQTPTATQEQTTPPTSELTPEPSTSTSKPAPEQSPSPGAQETQTAVPQQTPTLAREQTAARTSKQQASQLHAQSTIVPIPTPPDHSLRPLTAPPSTLPKPPPSLDAQTVAALDTVYQEAVKANDVAVMDRILADDFVLVTDRGASLTKAELIKEAREKRTTYEHQEEEEGTQKVRIWRDTAVVTALLRVKGTRDQNPFDYKVWFSETYVRTPTGWRYLFGQSSISSPKPDAK